MLRINVKLGTQANRFWRGVGVRAPHYCQLYITRKMWSSTFFEKIGYNLEKSQALTADGHEISGAVVMVDEEAINGHYDELTGLTDIPFLLCNGSCPGAYGDHLIVSDGKEWQYSEALHESNYPAVRVEFGGVIQRSEVADARKYWMVYSTALAPT